MTGWPAVAAMTGLMIVALIGFNVALYRRMAAATRAARQPERSVGRDVPIGSDGGPVSDRPR